MFGGLTDLLTRFNTLRKIGPLFTAIMEAETLRDRVLAAYQAAVAIAGMTPSPADDAILAYFRQTPGKFDAAVNLVVSVLELLGFDDSDEADGGPFGAVAMDTNDVRATVVAALDSEDGKAVKKQAEEVGIALPTLITVASLVISAIQNAPRISAFLKRLFDRNRDE